MASSLPHLQITFLWQGRVMDYRLLARGEACRIGSAKGVTFALPLPPGYPRRLSLLTPVKDGYRLRVGPGMTGEVSLRGQRQELGAILAAPAPPRRFGGSGMFRDVELYPGDGAQVMLEAPTELRLQITFTDPPERLPPPPGLRAEPLLLRTGLLTAGVTGALLALVLIVGSVYHDERTPALTAERIAKLVAPVLASPKFKAAREKEKDAVEARKKKEREAAQAKRMREQEGKLGQKEAPNRETVLPRGREDVLREKVAKTGLLAALGTIKPGGSGLGRLLDSNATSEVDQALTGLEGAKLVAGKGSGGLGNAGQGIGGGGTGFGRISGAGDLNVGPGKGRGRKGVGLGNGKEKEVQVGVTTGTPDSEGGLSKDQINRVVRAHTAAIRYCYEKELQRAQNLEGKIEVFWTIRTNGTVDRTKIAATTLGNKNVESCIERQVKQWTFPKSDAETVVQSYPFLFKGGA